MKRLTDEGRQEKARSEVLRWLSSNPSDRSLESLESALLRREEYFRMLLQEIQAWRKSK